MTTLILLGHGTCVLMDGCITCDDGIEVWSDKPEELILRLGIYHGPSAPVDAFSSTRLVFVNGKQVNQRIIKEVISTVDGQDWNVGVELPRAATISLTPDGFSTSKYYRRRMSRSKNKDGFLKINSPTNVYGRGTLPVNGLKLNVAEIHEDKMQDFVASVAETVYDLSTREIFWLHVRENVTAHVIWRDMKELRPEFVSAFSDPGPRWSNLKVLNACDNSTVKFNVCFVREKIEINATGHARVTLNGTNNGISLAGVAHDHASITAVYVGCFRNVELTSHDYSTVNFGYFCSARNLVVIADGHSRLKSGGSYESLSATASEYATLESFYQYVTCTVTKSEVGEHCNLSVKYQPRYSLAISNNPINGTPRTCCHWRARRFDDAESIVECLTDVRNFEDLAHHANIRMIARPLEQYEGHGDYYEFESEITRRLNEPGPTDDDYHCVPNCVCESCALLRGIFTETCDLHKRRRSTRIYRATLHVAESQLVSEK